MPAFAIGAALLAGGGAQILRSLASPAAARVWEGEGGGAERRVGRDTSLPLPVMVKAQARGFLFINCLSINILMAIEFHNNERE